MPKRILSCLIILLFLKAAIPSITGACIGRLLLLGVTADEDQKVMAEVLSTLISESTGTKINIVEFKSLEECRQAIEKGELDLYIDYVCTGLMHVYKGGNNQIQNEKAYSTVKHLFAKKFSLIWLKPFGYDKPLSNKDLPEWMNSIVNQAVCVARREVLSRFPVLPRLINKLKRKVSNQTLAVLEQEKNRKVAVKAFLKKEKVIRWSLPN